MKSRLIVFIIALVACTAACQIEKKEITIFLAGDSTMADKPYLDGNPEKGWGQLFPLYLQNGVCVKNHARNGRSTKSFIEEGHWSNLLTQVKNGDYVIIEFGHNDSKMDSPERYAEAYSVYTDNLQKFIRDVREKSATPILATPIVRRDFKEGVLVETHGDYPDAVRKVSQEMGVVLLDLHEGTRELVSRLGEQLSKKLYLHFDSIEYINRDMKKDDTHLSSYGAFQVCDLVIRDIKSKVPELVGYIKK